jgi:predicted glycoside hydrolase/deacetylase ChbG (UPF0249 family)
VTGARLIVSADDFGLTDGVDAGIVAAVAAGSVTAVGVMANLVHPPALATLLRARPGVSIGVHLNLTTGAPVSPPASVPSIVGSDGQFLALTVLTRRALSGALHRADVARELAAQVAQVRGLGVRVDHLDSHEHVHLLPGVFGAVIALAHRAGVPRVRSHRPRILGSVADTVRYYARHPRRVATHLAKRAFAARLRAAGIATPDGMVAPSLLARPPAGGPVAEWRAIASALPAGTWELVTHPADLTRAIGSTDAARLGELVERRGAELAAVVDPGFPDMIAAAGVTLVPFTAVPVRAHGAPVAQEDYAARRA